MPVLLVILLLSGVCIGGWRYGKRRVQFAYRHLDAEMEALRRAVEQGEQ